MAIPEIAFRGCCCDWGFERVGRNGFFDRFHVSYGSKIRSYDKSSGGNVAANFALSTNSPDITEIDPSRRLYYFTSSTTVIRVRKYEWGGTLVWAWEDTADGSTETFSESGTGNRSSRKIEIDSDGNVYVAYNRTLRFDDPVESFVYRIDAIVAKIGSDGNTVWTKTFQGPGYGFSSSDRWGYGPQDVSVLPNGNVHVTGKAVYYNGSTPGDEGTGRFEWHLDEDGNTLWSDKEVVVSGSGGDNEFKSWGSNVVSDSGNNVHIVYTNQADDSYTLVGYDDSGSTLYEYTSSTIPELNKIETRQGYLWADGASFGLRRYSTSSSTWDTTDWTNANGAGSYDWNIDTQNRIFMAQPFGFQARLRGFEADGTQIFNVTNSFDGPGTRVFMYPGRNFL